MAQNLLMLSLIADGVGEDAGKDPGDGVLVGAHDVSVSGTSLGSLVKALELGHGTTVKTGQGSEQGDFKIHPSWS